MNQEKIIKSNKISLLKSFDDSELLSYKGKGVVLMSIFDLFSKDHGFLAFVKFKNLTAERELELRTRFRKFGVKFIRYRAKDVNVVLNSSFSNLNLNAFFQGGCFFILFRDFDFFIYFQSCFSEMFNTGFIRFLGFKYNNQMFLQQSSTFNQLNSLLRYNNNLQVRVNLNLYFQLKFIQYMLFFFIAYQNQKFFFHLLNKFN